MKVFPLTLGEVIVPFGLFFGGLSGWEGSKALIKFVTDKSRYFLVPMHAYLVEHPTEGPILIDTGVSSAQANPRRGYYRGLAKLTFDEREFRQSAKDGIAHQLECHGYSCSDIRRVILTHMHEDHVGGTCYFPDAEVIVSSAEWNARHTKLFSIFSSYYARSFESIKFPRLITFDSGRFQSFDQTEDLFGDGTIRLLPTPGHTAGHMSVLLALNDHFLMVTGDAMYTLRHLATSQVQAIRFSARAGSMQIDSIERIKTLRSQLRNLFLLIGHDNSSYQWDHIVSYLQKGYLTPFEQETIARYEATVFDTNGSLYSDAVPRYLPPMSGGKIGTITGQSLVAKRFSSQP